MTKYHLFGAGWEGFEIEREDNLETLTHVEGTKIVVSHGPGAKSPEYKYVEFQVKKVKDDSGQVLHIACHDCDPSREEILHSIRD